jgi:cobalt/nickel transport system permease protein
MKYAAAYWNSINKMRQLSQQDTFLHRLPAVLKVVLAVLFLVGVLSRGPYELNILFFALAALLLVAGFGNVPLSYLGGKVILALPFVFFLGLSDLILLRAPAPGMPAWITLGLIAFITLALKCFLAVGAVALLATLTKEEDLIQAGRSMHLPDILLLQIELTLRYIGVLVEEAEKMYRAYLLKNPRVTMIAFKDMGTFTGLLLLRTLARAERVYQAMKCRGYGDNSKINQAKNSLR